MERIVANLDRLLAPNSTLELGKRRRLSEKMFDHLSVMCRQMAVFYPHQEMCAETVRGYLSEFEKLAVEHGIVRLEDAFQALRSKPGQRFFPHPSEVAEEIEQQIETERQERDDALKIERTKRERQADVDAFWNEILPDRMERFGWTQDEGLRRFPSFKGTKPSTGCKVVAMPARDRKVDAAGDLGVA